MYHDHRHVAYTNRPGIDPRQKVLFVVLLVSSIALFMLVLAVAGIAWVAYNQPATVAEAEASPESTSIEQPRQSAMTQSNPFPHAERINPSGGGNQPAFGSDFSNGGYSNNGYTAGSDGANQNQNSGFDSYSSNQGSGYQGSGYQGSGNQGSGYQGSGNQYGGGNNREPFDPQAGSSSPGAGSPSGGRNGSGFSPGSSNGPNSGGDRSGLPEFMRNEYVFTLSNGSRENEPLTRAVIGANQQADFRVEFKVIEGQAPDESRNFYLQLIPLGTMFKASKMIDITAARGVLTFDDVPIGPSSAPFDIHILEKIEDQPLKQVSNSFRIQ